MMAIRRHSPQSILHSDLNSPFITHSHPPHPPRPHVLNPHSYALRNEALFTLRPSAYNHLAVCYKAVPLQDKAHTCVLHSSHSTLAHKYPPTLLPAIRPRSPIINCASTRTCSSSYQPMVMYGSPNRRNARVLPSSSRVMRLPASSPTSTTYLSMTVHGYGLN